MKNLLIALTLFISLSCQASIIEIEFDQASYSQNEVITGHLTVSDLPYTLGGFASTIAFNNSQLSLVDWTFGNGFDDGMGSYNYSDDSLAGALYLEDYADFFAHEPTLNANQGASFILASFSFTALTAGIHTISLLPGTELISFDNTMLESLNGQNYSFTVTSVPAPVTSILFVSCLLLMRKKLFS